MTWLLAIPLVTHSILYITNVTSLLYKWQKRNDGQWEVEAMEKRLLVLIFLLFVHHVQMKQNYYELEVYPMREYNEVYK